MSKSFEKQMNSICKPAGRFLDGGKNRAFICLMTNGKEYWALTPVSEPEEKRLKQEGQLMRALSSNREIFDRFMSIVKPVERFYRRQDKKELKKRTNGDLGTRFNKGTITEQ